MAKLRALDFHSADFAPRFYDSDPEGTPTDAVVLLHGTFGSTASHYGLVFPEIARERRVIGLDFQCTMSVTLEDLVAQVRSLIYGLELQRPHIVGYSLGAVAAAAFAARHAGQVGRLVLLAGWARTDAHQVLRNDLHQRLRAADEDALREFVALSVFSPEFLAGLSPAALKATKQSVRFSEVGDAQMRLNRQVDILNELADITAETLVLSCTQDAMVPPHHQEQLAQFIPDAHREFLHGGHGIVFEDPDAVAAAITEFLR